MGEHTTTPKVVEISRSAPRKPMGVAMLETCKDQVFLRWIRGVPERSLAVVYQRPRPIIEAVVREKARERIGHPPAKAQRAA
jgi:hypothetical protein